MTKVEGLYTIDKHNLNLEFLVKIMGAKQVGKDTFITRSGGKYQQIHTVDTGSRMYQWGWTRPRGAQEITNVKEIYQ